MTDSDIHRFAVVSLSVSLFDIILRSPEAAAAFAEARDAARALDALDRDRVLAVEVERACARLATAVERYGELASLSLPLPEAQPFDA